MRSHPQKSQRGLAWMVPDEPSILRSKIFDNFHKVIQIITANRGGDDWVGWLDRARRICIMELHGSLGGDNVTVCEHC